MYMINFQNNKDNILNMEENSNQTLQNEDGEMISHTDTGIFRSKQFRQRKKTIQYGEKERSSTIYKYLKEKQEAFLNYKPRAQISLFSAEEDRILMLLVNKLGPKFKKIARYFPGKTINMVKNRYYKCLRNVQNHLEPNIEEEFIQPNKSRIIGWKLLNYWPDNHRMGAIVEASPLFPEAKELLHTFLSSFQQLIGNCQNRF